MVDLGVEHERPAERGDGYHRPDQGLPEREGEVRPHEKAEDVEDSAEEVGVEAGWVELGVRDDVVVGALQVSSDVAQDLQPKTHGDGPNEVEAPAVLVLVGGAPLHGLVLAH